MASDQYRRDYAHHLIEQVNKGHMTRRQLLVRASVFGFSASAAGSLLAACGGSSSSSTSPAASASGAPAPVMGGTLKAILPPSITDLDPVTIYDQGGIVLISQFCEYLIDLDNKNGLKPKLALSWSPNTDASVWTFKLREGVMFSDGSPFEAEDVVATLERLVDPKSGSAALAALAGILSPGGTKAVDAATVEFTLDKPFADFPYLVCASSYNTVMLPRTYKGDWVKNPVGTGPWTLKEYVAKQKCTAVKKPDYWGKDDAGNQLPYLDQVDWILVQDESAANLQLQSGAIDLQQQTVFQGSQALFADPNLRVDIYPGSGIREVAFNMQKAPWKDNKPLRQAVAYCLDRDAINKALYDGRSNLGYDTFWEPTVFPGSPTPSPRAQDYDKAKQLLTDAGLANGTDITLTFSKYLENPQFAQLIQAQCEPAGIKVKLEQLSYDAYYAGESNVTPWLNAAMTITEWGSRPTPGVFAQAMLLPTSTWSSSHWDNKDFTDTFNQYMATSDEASRTDLATKASGIQQDDTPILLAFYITQLRTQKKNVFGVQGPGSFYCDLSMAYMTTA
ncbi:MAG: ABC transporter substrate-binding protein [Actinobacteria bacterium]|nr:ABC transporter substrate-binding protein [Actinomycetota bacterium]